MDNVEWTQCDFTATTNSAFRTWTLQPNWKWNFKK